MASRGKPRAILMNYICEMRIGYDWAVPEVQGVVNLQDARDGGGFEGRVRFEGHEL